ncbi:NAD(P)-dependent oxidoreductase [Pigmentiphaga aceris]|uniref:NAD(P)-dependent oxidoreductase n=1 Tax=Pigmentiphaga aceris TaxID=1940612 RepID=A0A5C0AWF0_9BURK|nr:NAD(P)-dependent oxidoreductase [Pigmentiphaga aceris]QEI06719.1 NAD(P)-dependent oxidoreductase [Pigmentiphaga aceris]
MSINPILLVGGSGTVGQWTARLLRQAHPDVPLLIGGRDLAKAEAVAKEVGGAEGVVIDLRASDLGLGERAVSAVAVLFMDERTASLRFAQSRGVPHISISPGIIEMGPEVAAYIHSPTVAPVVLGTEWLVGATTIPTLEFAKTFSRVDEIAVGALLDEEDAWGPAADADLERQTKTLPAALARQDGAYVWRVGDDAKTEFRAADGTTMAASAFSVYDVVGLATATGAPNVRFSLALGMSSTRRRGEPMSTEIIIELSGVDYAGKALRTRHAVVHPEGQMPLTGLGVAMVLERLTGLDGKTPSPAGLYFPYQLLDPAAYFARLKQIGGVILPLDAA